MARKSKISEAEIIKAIQELEGGVVQTELARQLGVRPHMLPRWRAMYGVITVTEAQEKRCLESENRRVRTLVAQYAMDNESLKDALGKKWWRLPCNGKSPP